MTEFEINYNVVSAFTTYIEADSETEAREKFRELNMRDEVSDNILDGGLDHSEINILDGLFIDERVELPEVSTNIVRDFFTDVEWDAIESALGDYQDHGEEEANLMRSICEKMAGLYKKGENNG